jgi:hypothetical protein
VSEIGAMNPAQLQADALVAEIERQRDVQVKALLAAADTDAQALTAQAQDKARRERQRAAATLRNDARHQLRQLQASLEGEARRAASDQARQALARALPRLAPALAARWRDGPARQGWCTATADMAAARLQPGARTLRHPAEMPADEVAALASALQAQAEADPTLDAGLHVSADGAWVDATPAALLADADRVAALLRAALEGDPR